MVQSIGTYPVATLASVSISKKQRTKQVNNGSWQLTICVYHYRHPAGQVLNELILHSTFDE